MKTFTVDKLDQIERVLVNQFKKIDKRLKTLDKDQRNLVMNSE